MSESDPTSVNSYAPFDLTGRVVIVTGGGKGLGAVYAKRLAAVGAVPVLADIDGAAAEQAAGALGAAGSALGLEVDVADPGSVERMAERTLSAFGRIDGLVNNAALMSTLPRRSWEEIPVDEWDRVMSVNLRGPFLCCRAVLPAMKAAGYGKIVNVSSSRVFEGTPNRLHYTTSKAGIIGFTRALAREVGQHNVTVNAISPGLTLSDTQLAGSDPAYLKTGHDDLRALSRAQVPDDLVGTVLYLLSPASDFLTGQTINVDGGKAMH